MTGLGKFSNKKMSGYLPERKNQEEKKKERKKSERKKKFVHSINKHRHEHTETALRQQQI